jgi:SpoVK/Ycf46/Vps4 family AAA+-type ATPase
VLAESKEIAEKFVNEVCEWCNEVRSEILVFDAGYWYKDEDLFKAINGATFDNLILPAMLKRELQEDFARFFGSREVYERFGIPWKRGVLLIGPPGNGKTHTVKALINELKQPCLYVRSFKSHYGTEQENMKMVFERARKVTPCLLVMEDLDSLVDDSNRSFLLNELDGFAANTGVVVIATTNHPEKLDPAILDRPSRFDRKYYFTLPALAERRAYIESWNLTLQSEMQLSDYSMNKLAEQTEGFSFAYLKELFLSAMMQWIANPEREVMNKVVIDRAGLLRDQMQVQGEISVKPALGRN